MVLIVGIQIIIGGAVEVIVQQLEIPQLQQFLFEGWFFMCTTFWLNIFEPLFQIFDQCFGFIQSYITTDHIDW